MIYRILSSVRHQNRVERLNIIFLLYMQCALEGYTRRLFTKTLGWSKEDTDALISQVQEELQAKGSAALSIFLSRHRAEASTIYSKSKVTK